MTHFQSVTPSVETNKLRARWHRNTRAGHRGFFDLLTSLVNRKKKIKYITPVEIRLKMQ